MKGYSCIIGFLKLQLTTSNEVIESKKKKIFQNWEKSHFNKEKKLSDFTPPHEHFKKEKKIKWLYSTFQTL